MTSTEALCFWDEEAAYQFVERRVWPDGPICPHCSGMRRIGRVNGSSTRIGLYKCYECHKPFTVKIGTVFESSHVPLHLWLQTFYLVCACQRRATVNDVQSMLGVTLKTAWYMSRRIQDAIRKSDPADTPAALVDRMLRAKRRSLANDAAAGPRDLAGLDRETMAP